MRAYNFVVSGVKFTNFFSSNTAHAVFILYGEAREGKGGQEYNCCE